MNLSYFTNPTEFSNRLNLVLEKINEGIAHYWKVTGLTYADPETVKAETLGRRFVRLCRFDDKGVCRSVYCFVDLNDGLIYKAATFKAPEKKNPRGSIFDSDVLTKVTTFGAGYLRGGCAGTIAQYLKDKGQKTEI